ncbi:MAG TPA: AIR synthase-related protein, partial [Flavobacterium sp.]|nr:AIR synthase-related protein [Flavobacterium sp.]
PLQLPLNNVGVMALDFEGKEGVATTIGHAPVAALIDPVAGSRNAIAEARTNMSWAPVRNGIKGVSLSANWMWPCKNEGEDARLYDAVKGCSDFAIELGINIPTGKDSLSMKQKYPDGDVIAPGTVIISAAAHCTDITKVVEPVLQKDGGSIYYINLSQDRYQLGGSSFAQVCGRVGDTAPTVISADFVKRTFDAVQQLVLAGQMAAGHDVASGGLITTLLEMCFADNDLGANFLLDEVCDRYRNLYDVLFAENAGIVFQATTDLVVEQALTEAGVEFFKIGQTTCDGVLQIGELKFDVAGLRDVWFKTSYLLDQRQSGAQNARMRYDNYKIQPLRYVFPQHFEGKKPEIGTHRPKAAIIRE